VSAAAIVKKAKGVGRLRRKSMITSEFLAELSIGDGVAREFVSQFSKRQSFRSVFGDQE
jgi:hypothetical protein